MAFDSIINSQISKVAKNADKLIFAIDSTKEKLIVNTINNIEDNISIKFPFNLNDVINGKLPKGVNILDSNILKQTENTDNLDKLKINNILNKIESEVNNAIQSKNQIQNNINSILQPINTLEKLNSRLNKSISGLKSSVSTIKNISLPAATPPGVGIPINVIIKLSDSLNILSKSIDKAEGSSSVLPKVIPQVKSLAIPVITKLENLNKLFEPILNLITFIRIIMKYGPKANAVQIQEMVEETASTTQKSIILTGTSSNISNNVINDKELVDSLQPTSTNPLFYKDFKLTLEYNPDNKFSFPSRRIKGYNSLTNQILYNTGEKYSFSSSTQILIDEIKHIIDLQSLPQPIINQEPVGYYSPQEILTASNNNINNFN